MLEKTGIAIKLMAVRVKDAEANWWWSAQIEICAAASKTVTARDAADNASKHGPSVPPINAPRDKQSASRLDRFMRP